MKESKMKLAQAKQIAEELKARLKPSCERVAIAGSIRRQKPYVGDIELLCIPKCNGFTNQLDRQVETLIRQGLFDFRRNKLGSKVYGPKNKLMVHVPSGIGVDIFSTTEECWAVSLVVRTGAPKPISASPRQFSKRVGDGCLRQGFTTRMGRLSAIRKRKCLKRYGYPTWSHAIEGKRRLLCLELILTRPEGYSGYLPQMGY